jgi:predicted hydrocarbon binding protein
MTSLPRSGIYLPNRFARLALHSLIEVAGENGMHAVFRLAGLPGLIEALPPNDDLKEFDAADLSTVFQTINEIYGVHGGHSLSFKAGQMTFSSALEVYGKASQPTSVLEEEIAVDEKIQMGLESMCNISNSLSDQKLEVSYFKESEEWIFTVSGCAVCSGRHSAEPVCNFTVGVIDQALFHFSGGSKFLIQEVNCTAAGAETCRYRIQIPKPENPPFTV